MRPLELLFVVALILYSSVIWLHKLHHKLYLWMVLLFGIGLAADVSGTVFLCMTAGARWRFTLHTVSGLVSLVIMALHFAWALLAVRGVGTSREYFDRFSVYAWLLWLVSFISGIPLA